MIFKNFRNFDKKNLAFVLALIVAMAAIMTSCVVKISLSGASISPQAKTFSVAYFPNNAQLVAPVLSQTMTDALVDRMERQTRLSRVRDEGDLSFEGEITGYTSAPSMIGGTGIGEGATMNRLTITVKVKFTNNIEPQFSYTAKTFSAYEDYPVSQTLQQVESTLIPQIVQTLVNDIFNAAVAQW